MFGKSKPRLYARLCVAILAAVAMASPGIAVAATAPPVPVPAVALTRGPHMMPFHAPGSTAPGGNATFGGPPGAHANYYGGRVVSNIQVVQVLWGAGVNTQIAQTAPPSIASFYQSVLGASAPLQGWLDSTYNTTPANVGAGGTAQHIGGGQFVEQVQITPTIAPTCTAPTRCTDTDAQIEQELSSQIAKGVLPAPSIDSSGNPQTYYAIYFPPNYAVTNGTSKSCVNGGFLAYHSTAAATTTIPEFFYGVHMDMYTGPCSTDGSFAGMTAFQATTTVASHELAETITDPEVGIAANLAAPLGWYDPNQGEIGDDCSVTSTGASLSGGAIGADGYSYSTQYLWSNAQNACYLQDTSYATNDFGIATSVPAVTVAAGSAGSATISTSVTNGATQTVDLAVSGAPPGVTATLGSSSVSAGGSASLMLSAAADTPPGTFHLTVTGTGAGGPAHSTGITVIVPRVSGTFASLPPSRVLDSRTGVGTAQTQIPGNGAINLQIAGRGGVPVSGATAVVLNVTVTNATNPGFIAVYPQSSGGTRPLASNLNFAPGQTAANLVTVPLGATGQVTLYNGSFGGVDLVADVAGYYGGTGTQAGTLVPLTPSRILDTRSGTGVASPSATTVPAGGTLDLTVAGQGGVPASGAGAAVLNVTVVNPTSGGFVTVFPSGAARPLASNLNFTAGETIPNAVTATLGSNGHVSIYNGSGGSVDLVVDVFGYYNAGTATASGAFVPLTPSRVLDTRTGTGAPQSQVAGDSGITLSVAGHGGVPASGAGAVLMNTTATNVSAVGFVTVYPTGGTLPLASNLNFEPGDTVPNLVGVLLGTTGQVNLYNGSGGPLDLVADVSGYFLA